MATYFIPRSIIAKGARKYAPQSEKSKILRQAAMIVAGVFIGAVNGVFGAGGGMLAVPALTYIGGLDQKTAHASAIACMLPLCLISAVVYSLRSSFDVFVVLPTAIGVFAGGLVGAALLKKLPAQWLSFLFYALMMLCGIKMIWQ